jgi:hypothetical protein
MMMICLITGYDVKKREKGVVEGSPKTNEKGCYQANCWCDITASSMAAGFDGVRGLPTIHIEGSIKN